MGKKKEVTKEKEDQSLPFTTPRRWPLCFETTAGEEREEKTCGRTLFSG